MRMKEESKRARTKSVKRDYSEGYGIPEDAIRALIGSLHVNEISVVAATFQIIADLTKDAFENRREGLDPPALKLIKKLALQRSDEPYARIVKAIVASVAQGPHGINAAHLVATRVVALAFRWTREYASALRKYKDKLRAGSDLAGC